MTKTLILVMAALGATGAFASQVSDFSGHYVLQAGDRDCAATLQVSANGEAGLIFNFTSATPESRSTVREVTDINKGEKTSIDDHAEVSITRWSRATLIEDTLIVESISSFSGHHGRFSTVKQDIRVQLTSGRLNYFDTVLANGVRHTKECSFSK